MHMAYSAWRRLVTRGFHSWTFERIGSRSIIYSPGLLANTEFVSIGRNTVIRYGARIEVVLHDQPWRPSLTIGNNVNIEQNVHLICHDTVAIGDNVSIAGNSAIVDVTHPTGLMAGGGKPGDAVDPARSHVRIGENSFIGFGVIVLPNVSIGRNCVVGAGSVVAHDVEDDSVVAGVPARLIRRIVRQDECIHER
jgi:acetyltransferase-like isoleucine patch superfamily enzyme